MRPVLAGHIRYESLVSTELSLYDIAVMNDAMDVKNENEARILDFERRRR